MNFFNELVRARMQELNNVKVGTASRRTRK
jgi:hypothetical protein